jgi:acetylglutamate kinase
MSPLVVKVGGRVATGAGALAALPDLLGPPPGTEPQRVCIVHGGGTEISRWMERLHLPVRFKEGLRVTDEAALTIATMTLRGSVSAGLVHDLAVIGVTAVGLSGLDGGLVRAKPHPDPELGAVGEVDEVHPQLLEAVMALGMVPLIAPLGLDAEGAIRNINADTLCGAVAGALDAALTVFLTDVPGVLDAHGALIAHLTAAEAEELIAAGVVHGGMIPKVRACLAALAHGARAVCIADGRDRDVLPALLAGQNGAGTVLQGGTR